MRTRGQRRLYGGISAVIFAAWSIMQPLKDRGHQLHPSPQSNTKGKVITTKPSLLHAIVFSARNRDKARDEPPTAAKPRQSQSQDFAACYPLEL